MLNKNILASLRNLRRNRLYTAFNLVGLTAGFTASLLIGLYVADEWRFDAMHTKADQIFRLVEENTGPEGRTTQIASTALLIAERAKQDLAEIGEVVKMGVIGRTNVWSNDPKTAVHERFWHTDASFSKVFDFKWLAGDPASALDAPFTVVVTRSFARKTFGTEQALGKILHTDRFEEPFTVTGVLEDFPRNSTIDFPFAISTKSFEGMDFYKEMLASDWTSNNFPTWVLLQKDASLPAVTQKLNAFVAANTPPNAENRTKRRHFLLPMRDIHFKGAGISDLGDRLANPVYVRFMAVIALFLLGIACINYINLTTARAAGRSKEIGVRKAIGAGQRQVMGQFLTETYLLVAGAFVLALCGLQLILPSFNLFTGKNLGLNFSTDPVIWAGVLCTALATGLMAGLYPAFYLARQRPTDLFKRVLPGSRWEFSLRKVLVIAQFGVSVLLMFATVVVWQQMRYIKTKDLGFAREQLVVVDINSRKVRRDFETVKSGYAQLPGVEAVSVTSRVPGEWKNIPQVAIHREGSQENSGQNAWFIGADADFLQTYAIPLVRGRNFLPNAPADSNAVLLNETAARLLGIAEVSGQWVVMPSVSFNGNPSAMDQPFRAKVVGIVQDFHFRTLREKIAPLVLAHPSNPVHAIDYFTVRLQTSDVSGTLAGLESVLHATDPGHMFEWHFLDNQWALFYEDDTRRQSILSVSAGVAIFIACIGLFGLAMFVVQTRRKEIGVRKVLGASVTGLAALLAKDFLKLVLVALGLAAPLAYIFMQQWLSDFAYRIDIQWWMFGAAGLVALSIAFLTVAGQALKAALVNPVKSLQSE